MLNLSVPRDHDTIVLEKLSSRLYLVLKHLHYCDYLKIHFNCIYQFSVHTSHFYHEK